jgi:hypothetical protein
MVAGPDTILQANFKTVNDTLINVYAKTTDEFDQALGFLAGRIDRIAEVESHLRGAGAVAAVMAVSPVVEQPVYVDPTVQQYAAAAAPPPASAWGAPAAPPQQFAQPTQPICAHGVRKAVSGVGNKGEWRAYMCPTPKGTPGQCDPQWVQKNSPEWNAFTK